MRKYLVLAWLLLPLPFVVVHYGRGQEWLAKDIAGDHIRLAESAERAGDWAAADEHYRDAETAAGSADRDLKLRLDLARIRTRFATGDAVAAIDAVDRLLDDPATAAMPAAFRRDAREVAARMHYYAGWVMRLEGAKRELWMEEAELSRQNFRLLAEEDASRVPADESRREQQDLEAAVQLQRLSLTELMARPLPKEGQCLCNGGLSEKMAKRRGQRGKKPSPGDKGPPQKGGGLQRFEPGSGS